MAYDKLLTTPLPVLRRILLDYVERRATSLVLAKRAGVNGPQFGRRMRALGLKKGDPAAKVDALLSTLVVAPGVRPGGPLPVPPTPGEWADAIGVPDPGAPPPPPVAEEPLPPDPDEPVDKIRDRVNMQALRTLGAMLPNLKKTLRSFTTNTKDGMEALGTVLDIYKVTLPPKSQRGEKPAGGAPENLQALLRALDAEEAPRVDDGR